MSKTEDTELFESSDLGIALSADVEDISKETSNHIIKKMTEAYEVAEELTSKNKKNHFKTFQGLLCDFRDWDKKTKLKFKRGVKRNIKDIDDLTRSSIIGVAQIRFILLAKRKGLSKKDTNLVLQAISLSNEIPSTQDFLHWCACRAVKEVYPHPYLFDNRKKVSVKKKKENQKMLTELVEHAVKEEFFSRDNATYFIKSALNYVKGSTYDDDEDEEEEVQEEVEEVEKEVKLPTKEKKKTKKRGGKKKKVVEEEVEEEKEEEEVEEDVEEDVEEEEVEEDVEEEEVEEEVEEEQKDSDTDYEEQETTAYCDENGDSVDEDGLDEESEKEEEDEDGFWKKIRLAAEKELGFEGDEEQEENVDDDCENEDNDYEGVDLDSNSD